MAPRTPTVRPTTTTTLDLETRPHTGLRELSREVGRIRVAITCPFCGDEVIAYVWSLAGSGKKCDCGALLTQVAAWKTKVTTT